MSLAIAARIARRELRGGLGGFRVFLVCLALGVAAIAAVGSVRDSITDGLAREGAVLLGGDAEVQFTYRTATPEERAFLEGLSTRVAEVLDFRSMAVVGEGETAERALTQVQAVDGAWPLYGQAVFDPPLPLEAVLEGDGAAMERVLADRLGLAPGDSFRLGTKDFTLRAILERAPDSAGGGFGLGPKTLLRSAALEGAGLLGAGTIYDSEYRLALAPGSDLDALQARTEQTLEGTGARWRDARNGAPGMTRFVERMGSFLVLVGLAGLAVGGVGVSAAVRAYLLRKRPVIATLKTLGAETRTVFAAYLMQIGVLAGLGIGAGLILGAGAPLLAAPFLAASLPVPIEVVLYPAALGEAALYGALTALLFTLWPLADAADLRPAALFREGAGQGGWRVPRLPYLAAIGAVGGLLVGAAALFTGVPLLALAAAGGIIGALGLLALAGRGLGWLARRAARRARGRPALRLALGAVGAPGGETGAVVLSIGLGLSILAAVGQIDTNLRAAISRDLPEVAPSYFVVDIQNAQLAPFLERLSADPGARDVQTAPMLRGIVTQINGRDAREVAGEHWVVRGDRGITYAAAPPRDTTIVAGQWWPEGYNGPPQVSFAAEEAGEIGLELGDTVTVNILGRDITAEITSFREVDFSTAGIGFVMVLNEAALAGAPHTHIATIYSEPEAEAALLRDLASAFPNITAIRVRDALDRVNELLQSLAAAVAWAASATLLTGAAVLIGAAAAGERARVFEAAVLKTVGAQRRQVLASFALRSAMTGAAAGLVAIAAGAAAGWGVTEFVMDGRYRFEPVSAVAIVCGGALATLLAGLGFAWRPLAARPARVLRARD